MAVMHEKRARDIHHTGTSCSYAVYTAFSDVRGGDGRIPSPRSEGGKCGAVLAAEKILRERGNRREKDVTAFDETFLAEFGSLKCRELMSKGGRCNDYVGAAARIVDDLLG